ncbi:MAG TPA: hypothetical protein VGI33_05055 [Paenibacillus sp.]
MKKIISFILATALVLSITGSAFANSEPERKDVDHKTFQYFPDESVQAETENRVDGDLDSNKEIELKKEQVNRILEKLQEYRLETMNEGNEARAKTLDNTGTDLEAQLNSLGVNEISPKEALEMQGNSGTITPFVTVPPTTSTIKWYELSYVYVGSNGKKYDIQELYAQGLREGTSLSKAADGEVLYTGKQYSIKSFTNIASIYLNKLLGDIISSNIIAKFAPTELLIPNFTSKTLGNSLTTTYRSLTTACFSYIKPSGSTNSQSLSFISNMFSLSSSVTSAGYDGLGGSYVKTTPEFKTSVQATGYASSSKAYDSFVSSSADTRSFLTGFTIYNQDTSAYVKVYVATPSFPSQVY